MRRAVEITMVLPLLWLLGFAGGCSSTVSVPQANSAQSRGFGAEERRTFVALRGATRPVPAVLRSSLRQARNPEIRTLWLDAAKYVSTDTGFWVLNGPDRTCILQTHGGAIGCESRTTLLREGVALGVVTLGPPPGHTPREFLVAGIVPNRVRSVELKVGDGTRTIAVHDNAYSLRAPVPIVVRRLDR